MSFAGRFIGIDLTDPYAGRPRAVDVALVDSRGRCTFVSVPAFISGTNVTTWLAPITRGPASGDRLFIDGPLALASPGRKLREAERMLAVPGKTPDVLPPAGNKAPYAGFVRGSIELANALLDGGWKMRSAATAIRAANLFEAYPGGSWTKLAGGRLPKKTSPAGKAARAELLSEHGLKFARTPGSDDELDAALCGFLGWKLFHERERVELCGPVSFEDAGNSREGPILVARATAVG